MSSGERAVNGEGEEEETASGGMTWLPERRGDGRKEEVLERLGDGHGSSCSLRGCTRQGLWIHRSVWGTRLPAGRHGMQGGSSEGAAEDGGGGDVVLVDWIDPIWEDPEVDAGVWRRRVRERWDN